MYKVYVSDGNTELVATFTDLHAAISKAEEFVKKFPEYMVSIRKDYTTFVGKADWD